MLGQGEEANAGACGSRWVGTAGEPPSLPTVPFLLASCLASLDASLRAGVRVPSREERFPKQVSNVRGVSWLSHQQHAWRTESSPCSTSPCHLKAQKYHTGTKHIEQDKSPRTRDSFQSPSPACPCTPLPTPRLSADDSLEGLPPSQRPLARGCFWTLATSTCEGLTSRSLFPTVLSKRSLHQTFLKHITLQGKASGVPQMSSRYWVSLASSSEDQ